MIDLGDRDIEPGFESADEALYDTSFLLQGGYSLHVELGCHYTDNHCEPPSFGWACPEIGRQWARHVELVGGILYSLAAGFDIFTQTMNSIAADKPEHKKRQDQHQSYVFQRFHSHSIKKHYSDLRA